MSKGWVQNKTCRNMKMSHISFSNSSTKFWLNIHFGVIKILKAGNPEEFFATPFFSVTCYSIKEKPVYSSLLPTVNNYILNSFLSKKIVLTAYWKVSTYIKQFPENNFSNVKKTKITTKNLPKKEKELWIINVIVMTRPVCCRK